MRMRSRLMAAMSVAACVAAMAAGLASANRLSVIAKPIRATWTAMEFTVGSRFMMRCPVTLEGSFFSSTFAKVARLLVGAITRAATGSCGTELRATPLVESGTPWYIRYEGFTGTLPNITGLPVGVIGEAWLLEVRNTLWCLFRSEAAEPAVGTIAVSSGRVGGLAWNSERTINTTFALFECPNVEPVRLGGTSSAITIQGQTTVLTLLLI